MFICGSLGNEDALRDLFDKVFALYIDEETLTHRLATRTTNDWGKQPQELALTLEHHRGSAERYVQLGTVVVDAAQPVGVIADTILSNIQ